MGVEPEIEKLVGELEIPVTDPNSIEGRVLLRGQPILIKDVREVWDQLHPLNQHLTSQLQTQAFITVPLKVKKNIIGSMTVDRSQSHDLTHEDLELMGTVGNLIAIALDNAKAYQQIEELNLDLEDKVRKRTEQWEKANEQLHNANEKLQEMDRLKSQFLSHVSHELRTPLTAIKGFAELMLKGSHGMLTEQQHHFLTRVNANVDRLTRMIADLLDLARIECRPNN